MISDHSLKSEIDPFAIGDFVAEILMVSRVLERLEWRDETLENGTIVGGVGHDFFRKYRGPLVKSYLVFIASFKARK